MYETMTRDARFLHALWELDQQLAARVQRDGCRHCGARLHVADYPRKPRGGPWRVPESYGRRRSPCCSREGCRRRAWVPSALFLGRRVYVGAMVVLGAVLQHGVSARRVTRLAQDLDVDRRTLTRWRRWWLETFPKTRAYVALRAALVPPPEANALPASLVERFSGGDPPEPISGLLRWLAMCGEAL